MTDSFTPIEVNMLHKYYKILLPDSESVCEFVLHVLTASGDLLLCYVWIFNNFFYTTQQHAQGRPAINISITDSLMSLEHFKNRPALRSYSNCHPWNGVSFTSLVFCCFVLLYVCLTDTDLIWISAKADCSCDKDLTVITWASDVGSSCLSLMNKAAYS